MPNERVLHPTTRKQMEKAAKRRDRLLALKASGLTLEEIGKRERPPISRQRVSAILSNAK